MTSRLSAYAAMLRSVCLLGAIIARAPGADDAVEGFSDRFDGPLGSAWTIESDHGAAAIDAVRFPANRVLMLRSEPARVGTVTVRRDFAAPVHGTVRIRFFDADPGGQSPYASIRLSEAGRPDHAAVLAIQRLDAANYRAYIDEVSPDPAWAARPDAQTARSRGWHDVAISVGPDGVILAVDDQRVHAAAGKRSYDRLELYAAGASDGTECWTCFDDAVYEPSSTPLGVPALIAAAQAAAASVAAPPAASTEAPPDPAPAATPDPELEQPPPPPALPAQILDQAMATLLTATRHSDYVGIIGSRTDVGLAFACIMQQPEALGLCRKLVTSASPAGRLYGLEGLQRLDHAAFTRAVPALAQCYQVIDATSGCLGASYQVRDLVADLAEIDEVPPSLHLSARDRNTYSDLQRSTEFVLLEPDERETLTFETHDVTPLLMSLLDQDGRPAAHAAALAGLAMADQAAFARAVVGLRDPDELVPCRIPHRDRQADEVVMTVRDIVEFLSAKPDPEHQHPAEGERDDGG